MGAIYLYANTTELYKFQSRNWQLLRKRLLVTHRLASQRANF